MKTIGTEEHFVTDEVVTAWSGLDSHARDDSRASAPPGEVGERLREVGERRIAAMDEAGLDIQVISLTSPGLHNLLSDEATRLQGALRPVFVACEPFFAWREDVVSDEPGAEVGGCLADVVLVERVVGDRDLSAEHRVERWCGGAALEPGDR
jgi:hypothetical protein